MYNESRSVLFRPEIPAIYLCSSNWNVTRLNTLWEKDIDFDILMHQSEIGAIPQEKSQMYPSVGM